MAERYSEAFLYFCHSWWVGATLVAQKGRLKPPLPDHESDRSYLPVGREFVI